MDRGMLILAAEALAVYGLVLGVHSLRRRVGLGPFYALLGGLTAVMSWVTDAGLAVEVGDLTFMVGSTVFYTSLLLGVFVVYVFDGPAPTRTAILTVAGVSALVPLVAALIHLQASGLAGSTVLIPTPSLRINAASVLTTVADLVFLAVVWESVGRPGLRLRMWTRVFLTLLGVMTLDVVLFSTGAFAGTEAYLGIMGGTLASRFLVALFASPLLWVYLTWQSRRNHEEIANRPVLAIFLEMARTKAHLELARREVERRKAVEAELEDRRRRLEETVAERTAQFTRANERLAAVNRELVRANDRLERATDVQRRFVSGMSHEMRTPLNSIIGFAGILADGMPGPLNEEQLRQVRTIRESGGQLLGLVERVLDLGTLDDGTVALELERLDPAEVARDVAARVRPVADEKGLDLDVDLQTEGDRILSDRAKIERILLTLLSNAVKFTEHGRVRLRFECPEGGPCQFSVEDTGPGIPEEDRDRVFEPFIQLDMPETAKSKGVGLGLALARTRARMLCGDIELRSREGEGATFTLVVPDLDGHDPGGCEPGELDLTRSSTVADGDRG